MCIFAYSPSPVFVTMMKRVSMLKRLVAANSAEDPVKVNASLTSNCTRLKFFYADFEYELLLH